MRWLRSLLVLATSGVVLSQPAAAQGVGFGIQGGVNLANLVGEDADLLGQGVNRKALLGFAGGAFAQFALGPMVAIQPEAVFSMQGAKFSHPTEEASLKINFIQIPLLVQLRFGAEDSPKPMIFAGPQFGLLMGCKFAFNGQSEDCKDDLKSTDVGLVLGAGVSLPMGLTIDGRYNLGLTKIFDDDPNPADITHSVISVRVGFRVRPLRAAS